MRTMLACTTALLLAAASAWAGPRPAAPAAAPVRAQPPCIEALFVLDTTGSMGGLIEGAKLKIWSIAGGIRQSRPAPRLRIGLLAYRDRGDAYVTRLTDLSDDLDAVYAHLCAFQAGGGGDAPESVNQALHEAVVRPSWSQDPGALKLVFLVGDAPPHMDYPDDVKYPETCRLAVQRGLVVNTVQCGSMAGTEQPWREIATLAGGCYMATGQTGNMHAVATPMDPELVRLNVEVGRTLVPYGAERERSATLTKQHRAEAVAPAAPSLVADRLAYNLAGGRVVTGRGDLIDDLNEGAISLEKLDPGSLPADLRSLSPAQRAAHLQQKKAERDRIQARIAELTRQRQAWLKAQAKTGPGDAFDAQVAEAIRIQARRRGILLGKAGS